MPGKVFVVADGTTPAGRTLVRSLLADGARGVTVLGPTTTAAADVAKDYGDRTLPVGIDLGFPERVEVTFMLTMATYGPIDEVFLTPGSVDEETFTSVVQLAQPYLNGADARVALLS